MALRINNIKKFCSILITGGLLAICLAMLPDYLLWLILIAIFAHLTISAIRLFKNKSS